MNHQPDPGHYGSITKPEDSVFAGLRPKPEAFLPYGFHTAEDGYLYERDFMNGDFRAHIHIDKAGNLSGKVFDTATDEEYLPLHIESRQGAFVSTVRSEYRKILVDIAESCYGKLPFVSEQANRIADLIFRKYNDVPDFPWNDKIYGTSGVFRHPENKKWYALIMHVRQSVLREAMGETEMADVMNVKAGSANIQNLTSQAGVYPAYHMNHKMWVSVILDDTLTDERVMELVGDSYRMTAAGKSGGAVSGHRTNDG